MASTGGMSERIAMSPRQDYYKSNEQTDSDPRIFDWLDDQNTYSAVRKAKYYNRSVGVPDKIAFYMHLNQGHSQSITSLQQYFHNHLITLLPECCDYKEPDLVRGVSIHKQRSPGYSARVEVANARLLDVILRCPPTAELEEGFVPEVRESLRTLYSSVTN